MFRKIVMVSLCVSAFASIVQSATAKSGRGTLRGRTAQHRAIRFGLSPGHVDLKQVTVRLRCRGGDVLIDEESGFAPSRVKGGRVRDLQLGSTDKVWIRGRLRGRTLRGTIRVRDHWGRFPCDSGWVRFHASRVGA